ncbi:MULTISPECIES: hypothetical protein [unclassified Variovorax]|uniref:hypothetical protein n=1 Tax=unclassified Variovorax TaxID=663243 RepID=UPI001BD4FBED|nr:MULTISPECIES: hypothetical protein [unclassified Variovorax]
MSKSNNIAFHGSKATPDELRTLGGILPRVGWKKPELAQRVAALPADLQNRIFSLVGPVLRGNPSARKGGTGDADPDLSVSLTWNAKVACFFPPTAIHVYMYLVDTSNLRYLNVDEFAARCGVNRQYMKEIATSNVRFTQIMGYCIVTRRAPPRDLESIIVHQMEVLIGPYFQLNGGDDTGYKELLAATKGQFKVAESIVGTFHTMDSLDAPKKKDPNLKNPYL